MHQKWVQTGSKWHKNLCLTLPSELQNISGNMLLNSSWSQKIPFSRPFCDLAGSQIVLQQTDNETNNYLASQHLFGNTRF